MNQYETGSWLALHKNRAGGTPLRHELLYLRLNQSFPCFPAAIDIAQLLSFCVAQQRAGLLGVAPDLGLKRLE